jgi:hypothetical protein
LLHSVFQKMPLCEESHPSAAQAAQIASLFTARLKPCPFKKTIFETSCKHFEPIGIRSSAPPDGVVGLYSGQARGAIR